MSDITFYKHPYIDFLFGLHGNMMIPTKQDKFKPLKASEIDEDGNEKILKDLYQIGADKESIQKYQTALQLAAKGVIKENQMILKPDYVEVIMEVSMPENRFKKVDLDNLAKSTLDCLNGVAYEDDSQVTSLICRKKIYSKGHGILISISKITPEKPGFGSHITLFKESPWK